MSSSLDFSLLFVSLIRGSSKYTALYCTSVLVVSANKINDVIIDFIKINEWAMAKGRSHRIYFLGKGRGSYVKANIACLIVYGRDAIIDIVIFIRKLDVIWKFEGHFRISNFDAVFEHQCRFGISTSFSNLNAICEAQCRFRA